MRAVLDTNIVLDLLHFRDPYLCSLQAAIDRGQLQCFTDRHCLAELQRVSSYPRFRLTAVARSALLDAYRRFALACEDAGERDGDDPLPACRDADDQKFLVLARRCRADLLLTRDQRLLQLDRRCGRRLPFPILTARAACILLAACPPPAESAAGEDRWRDSPAR
ncbi:putative toxin-antitoxin system toxin component, PIN family [Accumulibacter sp.]|uniref:putative toxin-antitoxin system toxin component, PIN family n=1 Tax=Accumulibacter sp. TaxID=2053492 RepID=UPI0025F6984D|nr:putative toxin-antitoxin system toxin component, PIN family [Accumulibacter sp.]MCM8611348.1 putative toxin-antitoxin system toxin component, PIN family [Accumulibacter sp.]MCM8635005.1 putative toxin-antitoxin system toxin component, PIN family [Accumulibacter sp.]MCM8639793.1 putative toxin-antitoxin system toxin component, PIN family [Accumulibacter sp.]